MKKRKHCADKKCLLNSRFSIFNESHFLHPHRSVLLFRRLIVRLNGSYLERILNSGNSVCMFLMVFGEFLVFPSVFIFRGFYLQDDQVFPFLFSFFLIIFVSVFASSLFFSISLVYTIVSAQCIEIKIYT